MPVSCSSSAFTGTDGSLFYTPAATKFCLLDYTDFPAGTAITVPAKHDFRVGDPVVFTEEDGGNLDGKLATGTQYYVVATTASTISVSATKGGTAITLDGDGGKGTPTGGAVSAVDDSVLPTSGVTYSAGSGLATVTNGSGSGLTLTVTVDTGNIDAVTIAAAGSGYKAGDTVTIKGSLVGATDDTEDVTFTVVTASAITGGGDTPGGHIEVKYDPFGAICQAREWSLTIEREQLDVTTLPCGVGSGSATASKYAKFRKFQAGYASGSGTMTVYFTDNDDALGQRMLDNVMLSDQNGARVRLFIDTEAAASGGIDLAASMFIEADIMLESINTAVNPDDPTQAEVSFTISDCTHLFKTSLV